VAELSVLLLCLDVAAVADASKSSCEGDPYDFWTTNVQAGHRAFFVDADERWLVLKRQHAGANTPHK
jgi:hypothetical protein